MTGKHIKKKIQGGSSPCCFSEYARTSSNFFVQRMDSENPRNVLKDHHNF